jgi:orotate phosphoribosyltransferase
LEPTRDLEGTRRALKTKIAACIQTGRITLSSGKVTDFYFDGRTVSLEPEGSVLIATLVLHELRQRRAIVAIGGPTSGADPIVSATGVLAFQEGVSLGLFYVRKATKEHGMQKRVEGPPLASGAAVLLVDDVLTTGGSLLQARTTLQEDTAADVRGVLVLVDREEGGRERLEAEGLEVVSLFRRGDFLA